MINNTSFSYSAQGCEGHSLNTGVCKPLLSPCDIVMCMRRLINEANAAISNVIGTMRWYVNTFDSVVPAWDSHAADFLHQQWLS